MRLLITEASGFVGQSVVQALKLSGVDFFRAVCSAELSLTV